MDAFSDVTASSYERASAAALLVLVDGRVRPWDAWRASAFCRFKGRPTPDKG
jgi:hypothetical protein